MNAMLVHLHSGLRWIVLLLVVAATVNALLKWRGNKSLGQNDQRLNLFAMTSVHIQFLIGIILYFISGKVSFESGFMSNAATRFFTIEHALMMIIGVALISIGYSRAKRMTEDSAKFKTIFIFYLIGLLVILSRVPWPGMHGTGWG